jgi:hypothetical protein
VTSIEAISVSVDLRPDRERVCCELALWGKSKRAGIPALLDAMELSVRDQQKEPPGVRRRGLGRAG